MGNLFRSSKVTKKVLQHVNDLLVSPASVLHNIYIIPIIFIQKPLNDTIAVEEECIKQLIWFHLVLFYSSLCQSAVSDPLLADQMVIMMTPFPYPQC